jgi:hypothetical protein
MNFSLKKSKYIQPLFTVFCVFLLSTLFFTGCASQKEIKIGAITSLTGDNASAGIEFQRIVNLAITNINKTWVEKEKTLSIQWEDGECNTEAANTAVLKLIEQDQLNLILDGPCQDTTALWPQETDMDIDNNDDIYFLIFSQTEKPNIKDLPSNHLYFDLPQTITEGDFTLRLQNAYREIYGQEIQNLPAAARIYTEICRLSMALDSEGMNPKKIIEILPEISINNDILPF